MDNAFQNYLTARGFTEDEYRMLDANSKIPLMVSYDATCRVANHPPATGDLVTLFSIYYCTSF